MKKVYFQVINGISDKIFITKQKIENYRNEGSISWIRYIFKLSTKLGTKFSSLYKTNEAMCFALVLNSMIALQNFGNKFINKWIEIYLF